MCVCVRMYVLVGRQLERIETHMQIDLLGIGSCGCEGNLAPTSDTLLIARVDQAHLAG